MMMMTHRRSFPCTLRVLASRASSSHNHIRHPPTHPPTHLHDQHLHPPPPCTRARIIFLLSTPPPTHTHLHVCARTCMCVCVWIAQTRECEREFGHAMPELNKSSPILRHTSLHARHCRCHVHPHIHVHVHVHHSLEHVRPLCQAVPPPPTHTRAHTRSGAPRHVVVSNHIVLWCFVSYTRSTPCLHPHLCCGVPWECMHEFDCNALPVSHQDRGSQGGY